MTFRTDDGIVVGIDASRNRSGGAQAHLIGLLTDCDLKKHGIGVVHVWAFRSLLDRLPNHSWLIKHNPEDLERSLLRQLWWQANDLDRELNSAGCDILFATDASTLCHFKPMVTLSQDMLSYEPGVMRLFGFGIARLRLLVILMVQNMAFRRAAGVIFLTRYAAALIQQSCGVLHTVVYIPHGIGAEFKEPLKLNEGRHLCKSPIRCIYVSNVEMYKHQWVVVDAVARLRKQGHGLTLTLVGEKGEGRAQRLLRDAIADLDPGGLFVKQLEFLSHEKLPMLLAQADLFVFASSCENLPITLLEAMATGLPIACSNRGPMPEILGDGGVYFDPEDSASIACAVRRLLEDSELRQRCSKVSLKIAADYSWRRCSDETFAFLSATASR